MKPRPFTLTPLYEIELLALLLQRPELFSDYPDLWKPEHFHEYGLRVIFHSYLHIRFLGSETPSQETMENELLTQWGVRREKELTIHQHDILKLLRNCYTRTVSDPDYIIGTVLEWEKYTRLEQAIDMSVTFLQWNKPDRIPDLILEAVSVGEKPKMAGHDFYTTAPTLPEEVFPGVLRVQSIGLLLGASKSYKTWNLLNAAIASAMGKSWMGFKTCTPKRTLYCNMELHPEQLKERLDRVCQAYAITRSDLEGNLDFLNLKGYSNGIDSVLLQIRTNSRRGSNPYRLIIIDPIYKLYATAEAKEGKTSENDTSTVGALFEKLERLARELNSAILLAHHFKKGNSADTAMIDLGSGSGTFGRGPDALIALRPLEEDNAWKCECVIRYFPRMESFGLRLEFPALVRDDTLDLEEVQGRSGPPTQFRVEHLLRLLPEEGLVNKQWLDAVENNVECCSKTYRTLRDQALDRGLVRLDGDAGKQSSRYFLTAEGKKRIEGFPRAAVFLSKLRNNGNRERA